MADSSVLLEVIVEGKNIKVVQRDVESLTASVNKAAGAEEESTKGKKRGKKATDDLTDSNKNYNRGQKGVAGSTSNSTKAFSKQRDLLGGGSSGLVGAYATLAANIFAATALFGALQRAAQIEQLSRGLVELGKASGLSLGTLSNGLRQATGDAISLEQAMRSTVAITSAGLDPSSIEAFGSAARNIALALGRDTTDSLDRLTRGVTKLEPELLDELGLFIRVDEAAEKYALTIGKAASQLTSFEKRLAFQNATLEQAKEKYGSIGESIDVNPYDKLAAALQDLAKIIGSGLNTVLAPLIGYLATSPTALAAGIALLGGKVLQSAIGALVRFDTTAENATKNQKKLSQQLAKQLPQLNNSSKTLKKVTDAMAEGSVSTEDLKSALTQQENIVRRTNKSMGTLYVGLGKVGTQNKNAKKAVQLLNTGLMNNHIETAKVATSEAVAAIQAGNFGLALTKLKVKTTSYGLAANTAKLTTTGLSASFAVAKVRALSFASSLVVVGASFLKAIPFIGTFIAIGTILWDIFKGIWNYFKSDDTKQFESQVSNLSDTTKDLAEGLREVDKSLVGQSRIIVKTSDTYGALANNISQYLGEYEKLGKGGTDQERLDLLNQYIKGSELLSIKRDELVKNSNLEELSTKEQLKLTKALLSETQKRAMSIKTVGEASKEVNDQFKKLQQGLKITTPFTEATGAVSALSQAIKKAEEQGKDIGSAILENLDTATIDYLGLDEQANKLKEIEAGIKAIDRDAIAKKGDAEDNWMAWTFGSKQLKDRLLGEIKAGTEEAAKLAALKEQEDSTSEGIKEQVEQRRKVLKTLDDTLRLSKVQIAAEKSQIAILKKSNINQEANIRNIDAAENKLLDTKIEANKAVHDEFKVRKEAFDINLKDAAAASAAASAAGANSAEAISAAATLAELKDREIDLNAEDNKLTNEGLELAASKISEKQTELNVQNGIMAALQETQNYERESLKLRERYAKLSDDIANSQAAIARSALELSRAKTGTGLTEEDTANLDRTAADRIKTQEEASLVLKKEGIELEYNLLDAKLKVMLAELEVALEKGKLGKDQYNSAKKALDLVDIAATKEQAIEHAKQKSKERITLAENKAQISRIKADDAADRRRIVELRNRADFYESLGDIATATAMRELALTQERAILEQQIQAGKTAGLDVSAVEFDRLKKMQELIAAQKGVVAAASQGATTADRVKSFQGAGGFGAIDKAAEGQKEILTERKTEIIQSSTLGSRTTEQQAELDGIGVALERIPLEASRAKIAAMREQLSPMLEELKQLGPQGAVAAAIGEGSFVIQDSLTVLGTAASTSAEKLAAVASMVGAVASIMSASSDSKIASIDAEIAAEKKRDGKSAASLSKIKSMEAKKEKMARKAFDVNKKLQMASIMISTASAAMAAWAPPPLGAGPVLGGFLTAAIIAMGAAQLAIVAGTSYQGGGSGGGGSMPSSISVGERSNSVDVSQKASGSELAGLRGGNTANIGGMPPTPAFMGSKYRAAGGPTAGYVVGEQGPELFVPETSGRVVPNDEMRNSQPLNVNFTIQAIDSSNFTDALTTQRGNIIGMIREAANTYGETFLESVNDTAITTGNGKI